MTDPTSPNYAPPLAGIAQIIDPMQDLGVEINPLELRIAMPATVEFTPTLPGLSPVNGREIKQLAREGDDQLRLPGAAGSLRAAAELLCQRGAFLKEQEAPYELDQAAADARIVRLGETFIASLSS